MSILIVEDDDGVRESLSEILVEEGYSVDTVPDGPTALRYLQDHPLPTLILLDLVMPNMSGAEFRNRLLADEQLAAIPIIVLSARNDGAKIARLLGAEDFLSKPMNFDELIHVVQNRAVTEVGGIDPLPPGGSPRN